MSFRRVLAKLLTIGLLASSGEAALADTPTKYRSLLLPWNQQPGDVFVASRGMNSLGQVVAEGVISSGKTQRRVYFWNSFTSEPVDIGSMPGYPYATARAINNRGQVIGLVERPDGTQRAFLWDAVNGMQFIGPEFVSYDPIGPAFTPLGLNDEGTVVGFGRLVAGQPNQVLVWTREAGLVAPREGSTESRAVDINNSGEMVGAEAVNLGMSTRGWYAAPGESPISMHYLKKHGSIDHTLPADINNLGQSVGSSSDTGFQGFIWDRESGMRNIGTLGCKDSYPTSINDHGIVVGRSCRRNAGDSLPFIWDGTSGIRPLSALLDAADPIRKTCLRGTPNPVAINNRDEILMTSCGTYNSPPVVLIPD